MKKPSASEEEGLSLSEKIAKIEGRIFLNEWGFISWRTLQIFLLSDLLKTEWNNTLHLSLIVSSFVMSMIAIRTLWSNIMDLMEEKSRLVHDYFDE